MSLENGSDPLEEKTNTRFDWLALIGVVSLALAFRLPGLTAFLTADEARSWFGRSIIFLDSLVRGDFANTAPGGTAPFIENVSLSPAPGVTTMWSGALGIVLEYLRQGLPVSPSQFIITLPFDPLDPAYLFHLRLPNVLLSVLAVGLTYWWGRSLLGRSGALLAAGFLALDPFYLALTRVLGHDGLVATFMWLALLACLRYLSQPPDGPRPRGYLIWSGAFAGLAFLSKYPALFIGAFIGLTLLVVYLRQATLTTAKAALLRWLTDMLLWSVAAGLVFVLFWPAMWVDPLGVVTTILGDALRASGSPHQKGSFFLGQPVPDPGLLFYPLILLLRTTPVVFIGLLLSLWGLIWPTRTTQNDQTSSPTSYAPRTTLAILLAYLILYTLLVTYGGKKQDRYLLPVFPAVSMLAAFGYVYVLRITYYVFRSLPNLSVTTQYAIRNTQYVPPLLFAFLLILQTLAVLPAYPYYFSYYNPLAGGGATAARLVQVGWGEGLNEAAAYLNTLPNAETTQVVSWYSTTFEPYYRGQAIYKIEDEKISRSAKPGLAADYVVFYINQTQRQLPSEGALQYFQTAAPVYTVTLQGIDYAWIYPSVGMDVAMPNEARLVGQAELLGYDLTTEAGEPTQVAYPESVVLLSLYWEWQGKVPDEPIRISLVDESGATRGWGNAIETVAPLPYAQWQEGMVVRDDFALVIFPDTEPGDYRLAAWIERPATGETVGVFPIDASVKIRIVSREVSNE